MNLVNTYPPPLVKLTLFLAVVVNMQNSTVSITLELSDVGVISATATNVITGASLGKLSNS